MEERDLQYGEKKGEEKREQPCQRETIKKTGIRGHRCMEREEGPCDGQRKRENNPDPNTKGERKEPNNPCPRETIKKA